MSFKGKKNIYVCDTCKGHIVTVDLEDGVTPFMVKCRATESCKGNMYSSCYRVYDQHIGADYEWYIPDEEEFKTLNYNVVGHVTRGGLLLRKVKPLGDDSK